MLGTLLQVRFGVEGRLLHPEASLRLELLDDLIPPRPVEVHGQIDHHREEDPA